MTVDFATRLQVAPGLISGLEATGRLDDDVDSVFATTGCLRGRSGPIAADARGRRR